MSREHDFLPKEPGESPAGPPDPCIGEAISRASLTANVSTSQLEEMAAIGRELLAQDNAATAEPLFYVEELDRQFHIVESEADGAEWVDCDGSNPPEQRAKELDSLRAATGRDEILGYRRVAYRDRWERVTACFTRAGAEDFIRVDGHNHRRYGVEPRIFVGSGHRNAEWIAVRKFLMALAGGRNA